MKTFCITCEPYVSAKPCLVHADIYRNYSLLHISLSQAYPKCTIPCWRKMISYSSCTFKPKYFKLLSASYDWSCYIHIVIVVSCSCWYVFGFCDRSIQLSDSSKIRKCISSKYQYAAFFFHQSVCTWDCYVRQDHLLKEISPLL